jgi:hypothetical protein
MAKQSVPQTHRLVLVVGPELKRRVSIAAHGALTNSSAWARDVLGRALDAAGVIADRKPNQNRQQNAAV